MLTAQARPRDVWRVEGALNAPPLGEMRVGGLVNDILLSVAAGKTSAPALDVARVVAALVPRPRMRGRRGDPELRGRVLVTWTDGSARLSDLVLPVVNLLGSEAVVLAARSELCDRFPGPGEARCERELDFGGRSEWRRLFRRTAPTWARSMRALAADGDLSSGELASVAHLLLVQTQRAVGYAHLFALDPPAAILVEYDRGAFASPIVTAASSLGIPTMTMIHGAIGPTGYTPPLADMVGCWGDAQVETLRRQGVAADRLTVTGCPRIGRVQVDTQEVRERIGLDARPLVLLATNNCLPLGERLQIANLFLSAAEPLAADIQVAIRTHPCERPSDYEPVTAGRPFVRWLHDDVAGVDEALAVSDLVVCGNTAFADDAVIAGKVPVLVDGGGEAATFTVGLGAESPHTSDVAGLWTIFGRWQTDSEWRRELETRAVRRGHELCAWSGDDAAVRVATAVRSLAGDRLRSGGRSASHT